ncbi:pantetheine-phosphate adenylyltransferase [Bradymonas sediminis]|uniref:Phosphopantetheine adenylyltransferase n=1 Tax=Bradymonas sediminis TaxID=1548548 RepID=A0A2Z4FGM5_9DELT|nr:pantetheine-phosphate adenylyltransferase [Bradymonas sediminis]AWV87855.1 pantetheine-phosphate adenylyltransferase [Bradymonas sediminis]TDP73953.1 phosphopantetheine adenylyltransferase [Bradymonas sediminis]
MPRIAIYPGTFDPLTNGHVSILNRGLRVFDKVICALAVNIRKTPLFTVEERAELIKMSFPDDRVEVDTFDGLLVEYARSRNVPVILRGLRAISDFEYELQMANMNRKLDDEIDTVFMMTEESDFYVSSSLVKEVARFGGKLEGVVPAHVEQKLIEKFSK